MRNQSKLVVNQLDKKIFPFLGTEKIIIPEKGWIHTIRTSLNMNLEQLGEKLHITKQGVKKIEEREASESLSIKGLKEVAEAMEMNFVYGFVPKSGSIENLVNQKAEKLAQKIVLRTNQNMKLENQGNSDQKIQEAIAELAYEIKREMRKSLWD